MRWKILPAREFAAHAGAWQALNDRGPRTQLLDAEFIGLLLEVFGTGRELLAVHDGAMAVLQPKGFARWQTFQPSQGPLGAWVSDAKHPPSEDLLRSLAKEIPGVTLACGVTQIDPEILARPATTPRLRTLDYIETSRITIEGTFPDYWAKRPQNMRSNIRRRRRRLEEAGTPPRLLTITEPAEMARAVAEYGALESSGWKGENGTAVAADNAQGIFYTRMLEAYAERGEATVYQCRYGDRLAASDICIHREGVILVLKVAYDEALASTGPSFLLRHDQLQEIFESGRFERLEFYGKVRDWHTKLTDEIRQMYHITAYRWALVRRAVARLRRLKVAREAAAQTVKTPEQTPIPVL
ncbi:MAG TPA: GNAT family N-acetyltransferase [Planctomycetota bacterium]|nr:GNAT family N-acetyltransferase [Planctomycetota bacterium]